MQLARKKNRIAHAAFEALESRQMMSVSVAPSGGNDTAAIQNAINSTPAGTTVNLGAGTYHVNSMLNIDGHVLAGVAGQTTIQWTGASSAYAVNTGSNSELQGVTINGAGVNVTDSASNVIITGDTIENTSGTGIIDQGGCNGLQITHNTVQNIGGYGMVLYSINQANVDYNTITNVYEGIHAVNFLGANAGNNCTINYNTVTGITRHGIEVQNDWNNLSIGWNYVADFNVQSGGNSHMALSIATGPGSDGTVAQDVDVHDNVLLGTGPGIPSNPNYCFTAIEIMGSGSIVNHNYMANWGWGVLDGLDSNLQITNNFYVGTSISSADAIPENGGTAPTVDTGNVHIASWDGTVPSAFDDAGASAAGASAAPAAIVAAPTNLTATSPNSSSIVVNWQDQSGGKATYTIQIKSTDGTDPYVTVATLPAGTTSYTITGLTQNWVYNIQITANQGGQSSIPVLVQDQVRQTAVSVTPPVVSTGTSTGSSSSSGSASSTGSSSSSGSASNSGSKSTTSSSSGSKTSSSGAAVSSGASTAPTTTAKAEKQAEKTEKAELKAEKKADRAAKKSARKVSSAPPAVAAAPGHGLDATFSKGHGKNKVSATEVTADVDYTFSGQSDTVPALTSPVGKTNFKVTWTGQVEAPTSGKYQITSKADDGIRVWIDGKEVIDDWNVQETATDSGTIKLVAGQKYNIKVEFFQKTGPANAQLMWATKGVSKEVIPDEDLYLPAAA